MLCRIQDKPLGGNRNMVKIIPFKGITYNNRKIEDLASVMSPPYDIISEKMQEELYKNHPNNFVRLILGKQFKTDSETENRYTRANKNYQKWLNELILNCSEKPALYPYKISYQLNGQEKEMNGFFTLLKLDKDYKLVRAHEKTLSKPKADRLNLMNACHSNLEPIQLLYIDEKNKIQNMFQDSIKNAPLIDVNGYDQFKHAIWKISDGKIISETQQLLDDKILFIADGHHRYQTAINYAEEQMKKTNDSSENASFNYRMVILVNLYDEGLAILPTHRLIKLPNIEENELFESIEPYFTIEKNIIDQSKDPSSLVKEMKNKIINEEKHKFALFFKENNYILTLKDEEIMNKLAPDRSETWRNLDVSILHKIIIEKGLGITQETLEDHVKYTRDDEEAITNILEGKFDFSILMNATKIDELKTIADGGEHMPQKSTYFLPKMLSGLVMYNMDKQ